MLDYVFIETSSLLATRSINASGSHSTPSRRAPCGGIDDMGDPTTKLHFSPVISFRRLQTDEEHYRQQPTSTEATPHGQTKNSLARHNTRFSGTDENNETNSERATQTGQVARKCC